LEDIVRFVHSDKLRFGAHRPGEKNANRVTV
jgi:hypothetical protein